MPCIYHIVDKWSEGSFSGQGFAEESQIALEAEQRVFESGWFVFLEDEVADPSEAVPDDEYEENVGEVEGEEKSADELQNGQNAADDVQSAAGAVGVLRQVKRVKLLK